MPEFGTMPVDAWLWLAGSLLLAIFWTNLVWLFSPWVEEERSSGDFGSLAERIVVEIATWRFTPPSLQGLRLLYYVGLPFAALFWRRDAVVGRLLGLQPFILPESGQGSAAVSANWFDWLQDFGWAAALGLGSLGLLLLARWARRRALTSGEDNESGRQTTSWETIREAAYHEIHWAFYRNAPIVTFGLYWGVWAALPLMAFEALANPIWRTDLNHPRRASKQLLRATLAVVSSVFFLQTQNLWLSMVLHAAVSWGFQRVSTTSSTRSRAGSRSRIPPPHDPAAG
jgi:hypothetical protein